MGGVLLLLAVIEDRSITEMHSAWLALSLGARRGQAPSPRSGAPPVQGLTAPFRAQRSSHAANAREGGTHALCRYIVLGRTGDRVAKSRA
jgi:hypothetical protein